MYLFHGTSGTQASAALREGIKPRGLTGFSNWDHPSSKEAVYLTDAYAMFYGNCAAANRNEPEAAFLIIDVTRLDQQRLAADEDAVEQALRYQSDDPLAGMEMGERTLFLRDQLLMLRGQGFDWAWSLHALGNCTYHAVIPTEAITGVVRWERRGPLRLVCDPAITLMNYQIMGGYYRRMTRILSGVAVDDEASKDNPLVMMGIDPHDMLEHVQRQGA